MGIIIIDWDSWIDYIKESLGAIPIAQIATKMEVTERALYRHIKVWRQAGVVPARRVRVPKAVSTKGKKAGKKCKPIAERTCNGVVYLYKHTGGGKYKCMGRKDNQGTLLKPGPKPGNRQGSSYTAKTQRKIEMGLRAPKKEVVKLPTKQVDQSKIKSVRVSKTTIIQVSTDIPDEVAISNWEKKYKR